ncbi:unnamed protein product [Effrenium voratum]|nr:unnamed protein product [Effrenium voratum]
MALASRAKMPATSWADITLAELGGDILQEEEGKEEKEEKEQEKEKEKEKEEKPIQLAKLAEGKRKRKGYKERRRIKGERALCTEKEEKEQKEKASLVQPAAAPSFASHVLMCRLVPVTWQPTRWCFLCQQAPCRHRESGCCTRRQCRFCHCPEGSPTVMLLYAGSVAEGQ